MSRLLVVLLAFAVLCSCGAFLARPNMVKISTISRTGSVVVRQSDADPAVEKERKLAAKKAEYEDKMLQDAMQVTKNQQAFFSIGKFLLPAVGLLYVYGLATGGVVDLGVGISQ